MDNLLQPPPVTGADPAPAMRELGGAEAYQLKQQVQEGDFSAMRQYLARTRQSRDWQDQWFLLNLVAPRVRLDALLAACAAEPKAAGLQLLLGAYYFHQLGQSRGTRTAEQTSEEQFDDAGRQLQRMMDALHKVPPLDPDDPTPHVFAVRGLVVFSDYEHVLKQEYAEAVRLAPDCVPAHFTMVNARSQKWGGSHEESLYAARAAMKAGRIGSDMPVCLFLAHFFVWQYARVFDKNKPEAERYLKNRGVTQELNQALDQWIGGTYQPRRSSVPYLHQAALWYYLSGDYARLQRLLALTGNVPYDPAWEQIGDPYKTYSDALQKTAAEQPKKNGFLGWFRR